MSQWLKIDLQRMQNIVSQLHLAKTDPGSSDTVCNSYCYKLLVEGYGAIKLLISNFQIKIGVFGD